MADIGEESIVMIIQLTKNLLAAPAAETMRYCLGAIKAAGGKGASVIKASAAHAKDALDGHGKAGQVSMKSLVKHAEGAELVSIPVPDADYKEVQKHLKAFGVTFAVMEHPATHACTAHFKAASADQVVAALKGVIRLQEHGQEQEQEQEHEPPEGERENDAPDHGEAAGQDATEKQNVIDQAQAELAWMDLGDGEAIAEIDDMILSARDDGTVTITEVAADGAETERLSERCPIPSQAMARTYAKTQLARIQREGARGNLSQDRGGVARERPTKEVLKEARERADKSNEQLKGAPSLAHRREHTERAR